MIRPGAQEKKMTECDRPPREKVKGRSENRTASVWMTPSLSINNGVPGLVFNFCQDLSLKQSEGFPCLLLNVFTSDPPNTQLRTRKQVF